MKPAKKDTQLIMGRHPVVDALKADIPLERVWLSRQIRGPFEKEVRQLSKEKGITLQYVPKERLDKTVRGNHQGIIAWRALIEFQDIEQVIPHIFESGAVPLIVVLDGVTDVRNFGAIARSAEVMGAQAMVIANQNAARVNADAVKTSAGALNVIPVCRVNSLPVAVEYLQQCGIQVLVSSLEAEKPLFELDLKEPTAFVLGAEDKGVSRAVARIADHQFIIPQAGQTDSLNVSVAAGMLLVETVRQRDY
ncbi:MAG: 23S rRNA (guanosine(2251)-2'-O)-methyltransferase RlmB [Bacteroidota bacterium]